MKNFLVAILIILLLLSFVACGTNSAINSPTETNQPTQSENVSMNTTKPIITEHAVETPIVGNTIEPTVTVEPLITGENSQPLATVNPEQSQTVTTNSNKPAVNTTSVPQRTDAIYPSSTTSSKTPIPTKVPTPTKTPTSPNGTPQKVSLKNITAKYIGDILKTGDVITKADIWVMATYSNGEKEQVMNFTFSPNQVDKVGNQVITVQYQDKVTTISVAVVQGNDPNANSKSDFQYEIKNNNVIIVGYVGKRTNVIIPAWIDDMPVTEIENLSGNITSIVVPDSVEILSRKCFAGNKSLVSVTLGAGISEMGDNVFLNCENLKNVTLKNGISKIGDSMFSQCKNLESVIIPKSVIKIEESAFDGNSSLKILEIGENVIEIGDNAFANCDSLTEVVLPDKLTTLGRKAFCSADNLKSVVIGNKITSMGSNVFYQCVKLENVTIKEGAVLIGDSMFSACENLKKINLPESISMIENSAFAYCAKLKTITLPKNVKEIGWYDVFGGCNALESIYVEKGSYAEQWCLDSEYADKMQYRR